MKTLDVTFPTPEENLACDEALLDRCERESSDEVLRFWEPDRPFVVLGLSNSHRTEVRAEACRARGVPVLRRLSGGGAVLQGAGCLNFALILKIRRPGPLETITSSNRFILERQRTALEKNLGRPIAVRGCTDLALEGLKFSGNAQRRRAAWLLFHGTFLLRPDLSLMEELLPAPSRQPAYRNGRPHRAFLTSLPLSSGRIKKTLAEAWQAEDPATPPEPEEIVRLVRSRYSQDNWNLRSILP